MLVEVASALTVQVSLKEGPVVLRSLGRSGLEASYPLWDEIVATERFPAGTDSAFYLLSLAAPVAQADDVFPVETRLTAALRLLVAAWPFSGGSFIALETRTGVVSPRFESNARAVRDQLVGRQSASDVTAQHQAGYESGTTYRLPPLCAASAIATAAQHDAALRRLLQYHQNAWLGYNAASMRDGAAWFMNLYKVRELLAKLYRNRRPILERRYRGSGGFRADWHHLGDVLNNNDLRHAELHDATPPLSRSQVRGLFAIGRELVAAHLRASGLPTA